MHGQLALIIRILLYWAAGSLSGIGWLAFDREAGTITVDLNSLSLVAAGLVMLGLTFGWSRLAKARGGAT